jgi:hypothetical protein
MILPENTTPRSTTCRIHVENLQSNLLEDVASAARGVVVRQTGRVVAKKREIRSNRIPKLAKKEH